MRMVISMASHGGARNRSGPMPDPTSARSERRAINLQELPNEGYQGDAPEFPLGAGPDELVKRELEVWAEAWRSPQAVVWALEPWRWPVIAEYCRLKAAIEGEAGANAARVGQLHRYRDQIGLTPAGMRDNGWAIKKPDISPVTSGRSKGEERPVRRMRG